MERRLEDIEETLPRRVSGIPVQPGRGSTVLYLAFFCDTPLEAPSRHHLDQLSVVTLGRGRARNVRRDPTTQTLELTLPDPWASTEHARLLRAGPFWRIEDRGSRNGVRINGRSVSAEQLADGDLIEIGHTLLYYRQGASPPSAAGPDFTPAQTALGDPDFPTLSAELSSELAKAWDLAATDLPLLIQGESGTGKEVLARALSARSARPGPFVGVNCGAIPPSLVESELFGHVKGAFTGADSANTGLIRSAHRGTLFLDEIGDLELGAQAALLRVLQEREVRPVGSARALPVDVRVLSATHRDLDALVAKGSFRADLLARLAGFRLRLPPLWQRREDIGLLVSRLLGARQGGEQAPELRFEPEAARKLFGYSWPLNIRELDNCLRAATVLARGGAIGEEHLPEQLRVAPEPRASEPPPELTVAERDQRDQLIQLFREHRGNVSAVARHMGKARTQIQRWLKRYQLDPRDYLG